MKPASRFLALAPRFRVLALRLLAFALIAAPTVLGAHRAVARQTDGTSERNVEFSADSLVVRVVNGTEIREMLNPRLREGSTFVQADRMVDQGEGRLLFYRNVRIVDEGDTLTAQRVLYNRHTKIGRATGAVRLGDGDVVVTAPEGDYDANEKRADFRAGVTLVDSASVLTSISGSYWTDEKLARFSGGVRLDGDSLEVVADSLVYDREIRESSAFGQVVVVRQDGDERTWISGGKAFNQEKSGTSLIEGDVFLFRVRRDSSRVDPDTLMLSARHVLSIRTDSLDLYTAVDSVRLWRREFSAAADSMRFEKMPRADSTGDDTVSRLMGRPVAWFRMTQISGDTLNVRGRGDGLDTLKVLGGAFVARKDSTTGRFQQLRGDRMTGLFRADSLRSIDMTGQAEALYWLESAEDRDGGGVRVSADRILFSLDGDDVTDIRVYRGVEGTYYAGDLAADATDLAGLAWVEDRRPQVAPWRRRMVEIVCRTTGEACGPSMPDLPANH